MVKWLALLVEEMHGCLRELQLFLGKSCDLIHDVLSCLQSIGQVLVCCDLLDVFIDVLEDKFDGLMAVERYKDECEGERAVRV